MTTTRTEARDAIRQALLDWKAAGEPNPVIPVYADEDGDGIPDFYGLDSFGNLTLVSGVVVEDTVAISTGDGIEVGAGG